MKRKYYKWIPIIGLLLVTLVAAKEENIKDTELGFDNNLEYFGSIIFQIILLSFVFNIYGL